MHMKNNGFSNPEIGEKLGVSTNKIGQRCVYLRKQGRKILKGKAGRKSTERPKKAVPKKAVGTKKTVSTSAKAETTRPVPALRAEKSTPMTEVSGALAKLSVYVAMLEAKNASLQKRLTEIEKLLRE